MLIADRQEGSLTWRGPQAPARKKGGTGRNLPARGGAGGVWRGYGSMTRGLVEWEVSLGLPNGMSAKSHKRTPGRTARNDRSLL